MLAPVATGHHQTEMEVVQMIVPQDSSLLVDTPKLFAAPLEVLTTPPLSSANVQMEVKL